MFTLKKFLLITAAAAVVGIGAALVWTHYQAGNINEAAAQSVNTEAPDITVTAMDGTEVKLSSLRGKTVFVNFWATWCGPCMGMAPVIDRLADEYEGRVVIGKYNVDEETDFSTENRIMSLPTILFFKDGKKTDLRLAGSQSEDKLRETIDKLLAL